MATEIRDGEIAMMGEQTGLQPKIFYPHMNLEQKIPRRHLLRRIQEQIDFEFIYAEVRDTYGNKGNVSIPPPGKADRTGKAMLHNLGVGSKATCNLISHRAVLCHRFHILQASLLSFPMH